MPYPDDDSLSAEFEFGDEGHFEVYGDNDYFTIFDQLMDSESCLHITWLYSAKFFIAQVVCSASC